MACRKCRKGQRGKGFKGNKRQRGGGFKGKKRQRGGTKINNSIGKKFIKEINKGVKIIKEMGMKGVGKIKNKFQKGGLIYSPRHAGRPYSPLEQIRMY